MARLGGSIDGELVIGRIHASPYGGVVVNDVAIIDRNAPEVSWMSREDTLFRAGQISATFSTRGLLSRNGIHLKNAKIKDGLFVLTSEPSSAPGMKGTSNIARVFRLGSKGSKEKKKDSKDVLHIDVVEVDGLEYRMKNCKMPPKHPDREGTIDWGDLDVDRIAIRGRDLSIRGGIIGGTVDSMSFTEKSGFSPVLISGKAKVGNGATIVNDLRIVDSDSDISMSEYRMTYESSKSFSHYLQEVRMDAQLNGSKVSPKTISYFAYGMKKMDFDIIADGGFHGTVSDFELDGLSFRNTGDRMHGTIDGRISGLPSVQDLDIDARLTDTSFTAAELSHFIGGIAPGTRLGIERFAKGQTFTMDGRVKGSLDRLAANIKAASTIGNLNAEIDLGNALDRRRPVQVAGSISTHGLDLGKILGKDILGQATLFTRAGATLGKGDLKVVLDTLAVSSIEALGYSYSDIHGKGRYGSDGFEGTLYCSDPNLSLSATASRENPEDSREGNSIISLDIPRADLSALKLYRRGTCIVSLSGEGHVSESIQGSRDGEIQINDIIIQGADGLHRVGDVILAGRLEKDLSDITLDSPAVTGKFKGTGSPVDFISDIRNMALRSKVPAVFGEPDREWSGNSYDLELGMHDTHDLLTFFVPGLYIADNTNAWIGISKGGLLQGRVESGRLAIRDKYLKGVGMGIDNTDGILNAVITSDELSVSPILTRDNSIMAFARDNSIGLNFSYDNQTELDNKGEIYLSCDLERTDRDSLDVHARILRSNIYLNSDAWAINPAQVDISGGHIRVGDFRADCDSQSITIDGGFSRMYTDSLNLNLRQFNIQSLSPFLGGKLDIGGFATGSVSLLSPVSGSMGAQAGIRIDSTMISGKRAGTMILSSNWNEERNGLGISIRNMDNGIMHLNADGLLIPSEKTVDASIRLEKFNLGYAESMLQSVFSEFGGDLTGSVRVSGPLDRIDMMSDNLRIENGLLRVDFTNVPYSLSGAIGINNDGVVFMNDVITDRFGERGRVSGGIGWNRFRDIRFDTRVDFRDMELMDILESSGQAFYGQAFGSGQVRISGPMNAIQLDVDASTSKEGNFHLPMSGASSASHSDLLTFKEPEVEYVIDPYEVMMGRYSQQAKKARSDMGILLRLNVDQGTQALVELDKASGNILSGRGSGSLDIEVRPSRDVFNMNGNYNLTSGNYHLDVLGIAQKDFAIQDGSTVRFSGDIMDSDLDINAVYRTKASIGTLIADTTSTARRTVECGISISDKIRNPQIGFSINVPDIDPTTQAMVENALNTEDKIQKQFISLLISSSFLPDEQSGIVNNTNMLNTTVTEIMAGQLNNILQKLDIPIDLGLDFQQGNNGKSMYDVAISTELFNSKVLVNGTIGNRQYGATGFNSDEVVGDLDIEIKMDRTGALRFNLFSHSADQYTSYLDNSQRNGAGITYQREFNSFMEFFRSIFRRKDGRAAAEAARQEELRSADRTIIRIEE